MYRIANSVKSKSNLKVLSRVRTSFSSNQVAPSFTVCARSYSFASKDYHDAIIDSHIEPDLPKLRQETLNYIDSFDKNKWYDDPIVTVVNGKSLKGGSSITTMNAFNRENGRQILATSNEIDTVMEHIKKIGTDSSLKNDYREPIRKLEQDLLNELAPQLVGNQAMDFMKQDGITEIEESIQANLVERKLNDLLFKDEQDGKVVISRLPAFCLCVSNFTNFLDLFRKTLRNLELGVPVVVFSRTNTTQHMYRWFQILAGLLERENVNPALLTYVSCDVTSLRKILIANPESPAYFTGSREIAAEIKKISPKLMASTGGPNTMVTTVTDSKVLDAAKLSASIENSGQCTALRHLVAPNNVTENDLIGAFDDMPNLNSPSDALAKGEFAGVFKDNDNHNLSKHNLKNVEDGYKKHPNNFMAYRINDQLPIKALDEHWREVYVDLTLVDVNKIKSLDFQNDLATWLNAEQPISLSVNGKTWEESFSIMQSLFEKTTMVVNTIGNEETPSLTAQARPQDGEVFGEFPPRRRLSEFTKFPVIVPSSTPGYNSTYNQSYLKKMAEAHVKFPNYLNNTIGNLDITSAKLGYMKTLVDYLNESCGPKRSKKQAGRTALWGLQKPPSIGKVAELRVCPSCDVGDVACFLMPFLVTNANTFIHVSVDPANKKVLKSLEMINKDQKVVKFAVENDSTFEKRSTDSSPWNIIHSSPFNKESDFVLASHFISLIFPLGHIKSTRPNDQDFLDAFNNSPKWLRTID